MSYRYDMTGKNSQQQAIVRKRDEEDRRRKDEDERKSKGQLSKREQEPINETDYCTVWKRVTLEMDNNDVAAIELINVKEYDRDEIRFAFYKKNEDGKLSFIPRALDLTPSALEELLSKARQEDVIK